MALALFSHPIRQDPSIISTHFFALIARYSPYSKSQQQSTEAENSRSHREPACARVKVVALICMGIQECTKNIEARPAKWALTGGLDDFVDSEEN